MVIKGESLQTTWEDDGTAHVRYLDCKCGTRIISDKTVSSGDEVQCPACGQRYQFFWGGMQARPL